MNEVGYELVVTAPAARAIREALPEAVAFAVIEFITGPYCRTHGELALPCEASWRAS